MTPAGARKATVWLAGAGLIGSHTLHHFAAMPGLLRVIIVDKDVFESRNLRTGQAILPGDVGRPKAAVAARRLRSINPAIEVEAVHGRLDDVPLGRFWGAAALFLCLDSRRARRDANGIAVRLGIPLIDTGVAGSDGGWWVRVDVYDPGPARACLECAWSQEDYDLIERVYACGEQEAEPTDAPSFTGAAAAAIGAAECRRILEGDGVRLIAGRRVLFDLRTHSFRCIELPRNPACRSEHVPLSVADMAAVPLATTLKNAFRLCAGEDAGGRDPAWLAVEGRSFVRKQQCTACGAANDVIRLAGRLRDRDLVCPCGGALQPVGFAMETRLFADRSVPPRCWRLSLARIGLRPGDVFSVGSGPGRVRHFFTEGPSKEGSRS